MNPICVIIDAYGPAQYLVSALMKRGFDVIHIQSDEKVAEAFLPFINKCNFLTRIKFEGSLYNIVSQLAQFSDIKAVIAGFETGVMLADQLSEALHVPSNGTKFSLSRRNKYEMAETLRRSDLTSIPHIKHSSLSEIQNWFKLSGFEHIVLKPLDSAGSDNVYVCSNAKQIEDAFCMIINNENLLGLYNSEVIAQPYLQGTEYVVDTVSCKGQHRLISISRYTKVLTEAGRIIYDKEELIPWGNEETSELKDYVFSVLDGLEIKYGPTHCEVMLTKNGPVLIEIGTRLHGGINPIAQLEVLGYDQIEIALDAYIDNAAFLKFRSESGYHLKKHMYLINAISTQAGKIDAIPFLTTIENLPSFQSMRLRKTVGDDLQKTIDLATSPAIIYLISQSKDQIETDYQTVQNLFKSGYILEK